MILIKCLNYSTKINCIKTEYYATVINSFLNVNLMFFDGLFY